MNEQDSTIRIGFPSDELEESLNQLPPADPGAPKVVFKSGLKLDRTREKALCEHATKRYTELCQELGHDETVAGDDGVPMFLGGSWNFDGRGDPMRKFMPKRMLYQMTAENDVSWRPIAFPESIFGTSNLTVPISRRIARQMGARAINYFFGTDPYFACYPVGGLGDDMLARAIQKMAELKIEWSGSKDRLRNAVELAFNIGESVLKVSHEQRASFFRRTAVVAVGPDGEPLLAADGREITQDDLWVPDEAGNMVLKRSPETPMPAGELVFQELLLDEEILHYSGPRISHLYWRDFLCPLQAEDVQRADCIVHLMDYTASTLAEAYMSQENRDLAGMQNAAAAIKDALGNDYETKTGDAMPRGNMEGEGGGYLNPEPTMLVGEFYLRFDADGDGFMEDIMLVMDIQTETPIYYDYVAAVTDDGQRPFHVLRPFPVQGRWYGQGAIELFERHQETIDLMTNRRNRSQSEAGRVTLWNPSATHEGSETPHLVLNWGKTYTIKDGKKLEDVLQVVYLEDNKYENLTQEIEFFLQLALNESGVSHANDNAMSGMDSSKLATGIRNIEKTGMELFAVPVSNLETGITSVLESFMASLFATLDEEETFTILEGEVPMEMTLAKRDVHNLKANVRMLLTRFKDEQVLQSSTQAVALVRDFYSLPPPLQQLLAPLYARMLKSLQIQGADNFIIPQQFALMPDAGGPPGVSSPADQPKAPPPNI